MPLNWGPRSGGGEEHEPNQKFVFLIIRCEKDWLLSLYTHTLTYTLILMHTEVHTFSLSPLG